jgi:hypothetical protein
LIIAAPFFRDADAISLNIFAADTPIFHYFHFRQPLS